MKEGEIARLEEGNIGRERKCSADQGMGGGGGWGVKSVTKEEKQN